MQRGKPLSFERDKVLCLAMELFWQKGYQRTSMADLLAHMGIQRQSFYNTFGSKEKIFIESIALYSDTVFKEFITLLDQPGNPIENIKQALKLWEGMVIEYGGCMLCNSISEFSPNNPEIADLLKEKIKRPRIGVLPYLRQGHRGGLFVKIQGSLGPCAHLYRCITGQWRSCLNWKWARICCRRC